MSRWWARPSPMPTCLRHGWLLRADETCVKCEREAHALKVEFDYIVAPLRALGGMWAEGAPDV